MTSPSVRGFGSPEITSVGTFLSQVGNVGLVGLGSAQMNLNSFL